MSTNNFALILPNFFFFTSILLLHLPTMTMSDDTCPYPCYPPPTGTGTATGTTQPSPSSQSGSYPPPAGNYPSPTGNNNNNNFPYNNYYPPPSFGNNYFGQPPPDPILPYFPFYYRKPPHKTDVSPAAVATRSTFLIAMAHVFLLSLLFSVFL
ncbi:hypothetical protein JCGZ_04690 [Jatropha curcas]|uniref:Uncharacterized protein n=1 Tax=Jatropha curcas TaxID=180498 RepID=A0A067KPH5_JATCU|nr:hypothetical protein JCGZ_04690 [Jatropha curcas]